MTIDTQGHNLINTNSGTQGGLLSQGNLSLKNVGLLDNKLGYLASGQNLGLSANQVQNSGGTLLAAQNLKLQGIGQNQLLNNQSGQILSMGDMQPSVEHINNQGNLHLPMLIAISWQQVSWMFKLSSSITKIL